MRFREFQATSLLLSACLFGNIVYRMSQVKADKMEPSCNTLIEIGTKNGIKVYGAFVDNLQLPLLILMIYKNVSNIDKKLSSNGWTANKWGWPNGAASTPHYHHNCHETLVVKQGHANIKWGKFGKLEARAYAGDVIFQPAGLYHAGNGCSNDCYTMGVYPNGSAQWTFNYNGPNNKQLKSISNVKIPSDPVFGGDEINEFAAKLLQQQS
eukprot:619530_1